MIKKTFQSQNLDEFQKISHEFSETYKKILLNGQLGAGKTTFVSSYVEAILGKRVASSPTYAYMNVYENTILHIDMYRIESSQELIEKGILDAIHSYSIVLIERPKFIELYKDDIFIELNIDSKENGERILTIS